MACIPPNPRRVGYIVSYTWASKWASIHRLNILQHQMLKVHQTMNSFTPLETSTERSPQGDITRAEN